MECRLLQRLYQLLGQVMMGSGWILFIFTTIVLLSAPIKADVVPDDGNARYEMMFWESIKDSKKAEDYDAYLEAFPNGRFAPLAKVRAGYIRKYSTPSPQPEDVKIEAMTADYLVAQPAHLREKPSAVSSQIDELSVGTQIRVTGQVTNSNWYRVETLGGKSGFVYGSRIKRLDRNTASQKPKSPTAESSPSTELANGEQSSEQPEAAVPLKLEEIKEFKDCSECPIMVRLPAGSFLMGDERGDRSEKPAHRVSIPIPFSIGKYEITVGEWQACVLDRGCAQQSEKVDNSERAPIRDISWTDAQMYVNWLSQKTGDSYRLPTESEWEYAARGGTTTRYWWGDQFQTGKLSCKGCGGSWNSKFPAQVGSHAANPFGLHDMNGNVWEWVSDCWHDSYIGAPSDGSSWEKKNCRTRVLRGGSWRNDSSYMYSATRFRYDADVRYLLNGFRVAKTLDNEP